MKLFQIEEPDGSPVDTDSPGAAIGIDLTGGQAEIAFAVGGNAVMLNDRDGFALDLAIPAASENVAAWQSLFEGARIRAERALARPVTHAVVAVTAPLDAAIAVLDAAAAAAGVAVLRFSTSGASGAKPHDAPALTAALLAEELAPRSIPSA